MATTMTMHAIQYDSIGGGTSALKRVEIPVPSPKEDEVLIKAEVVSLNPADWMIQLGFLQPHIPGTLPFIPATDVAGEIVQVGSAVTNFKPGDKVVAALKFLEGGGLAEYSVASAKDTVLRPPEVGAAEGSGLPIAGITALQALKTIGLKFDGTDKPINVLVTAASGGVGHYAVQLAKLANLHVTATCGARNIELVKSLGADEVLDYKTPEGASLKSPSGKMYDGVVCNNTGTEWSTFEQNLSESGKVISIGDLQTATSGKKQMVRMIARVNGEELEFLVGLAKDGKIKTVIDSKFPFSKVDEAWAKSMEKHATGKIVVEMGE